MSDHLLRLAKLTLRLAGDLSQMDEDGRNLHAELFDFVRDLEAAPRTIDDMQDPPSGIVFAPAPERRTITREEFGIAIALLENARSAKWGTVSSIAKNIAIAWRITVEDA